MGNRIRLENHHSLEDLEYSYHSSRCAVFTRHVLVLSLVLKDYSTQQICDITHLSENWVYTICKRYNEGGLKALVDHRTENTGRPPVLSNEELERVKKSLESLPVMAACGVDLKSQTS